MSRYLQGDEGFEYKYITVRRDLPIERLAHVARSGTLRLVVDHYHFRTDDGESQSFVGGELGPAQGELGESLFALGLGCSSTRVSVCGSLSLVSLHGGLAR
jgi:hypothetical protein